MDAGNPITLIDLLHVETKNRLLDAPHCHDAMMP